MRDNIMKIRLLITGGTIDKVYNQSNGELEFDQTHFPEILSRARVEVDLLIEELILIDSLDMVDADRELIVDKCTKCEEKHILITHGTDKWKTTEEELPPNPMADQIESMIDIIKGTIVSLKKEVDVLKEKKKENE